MNLQIVHNKTAKWKDGTWDVTDKPSYFWEHNGTQSPTFAVFADALNWIIKHDEERNQIK
jgi:hypothetical protein